MDRLDSKSVSWFASRAGRRYWLELAWLLAAKLAALMILYYAFVAPQPRADLSPGGLQHHLLDANPIPHSSAPP